MWERCDARQINMVDLAEVANRIVGARESSMISRRGSCVVFLGGDSKRGGWEEEAMTQ
jgi:hypothetical protein